MLSTSRKFAKYVSIISITFRKRTLLFFTWVMKNLTAEKIFSNFFCEKVPNFSMVKNGKFLGLWIGQNRRFLV